MGWNSTISLKNANTANLTFTFSINYGGNDSFLATFNAPKNIFDYYQKATKLKKQPNLSDGQDYMNVGSRSGTLINTLGGNDFVFVNNVTAKLNIDLGDGSDVAIGGYQNDTMLGGNGNDVLIGNKGDDYLSGDAGNDQLQGGDGQDVLLGGGGNDILTGGDGADIFKFMLDPNRIGLESDIITDFNFTAGTVAVDTIDLSSIWTSAPGSTYKFLADSKNKTMIAIDINADGAADMNILLRNVLFDPNNNSAIASAIRLTPLP